MTEKQKLMTPVMTAQLLEAKQVNPGSDDIVLTFDRPVRLTGAPCDLQLLDENGQFGLIEAQTLQMAAPHQVRLSAEGIGEAGRTFAVFVPENCKALVPLEGSRLLAAAKCFATE